MNDQAQDEQRVAEDVRAAREEYADEEAEAAEVEIAERNAALTVPLNLRIDNDLDSRLKRRAAAEQIPTSALVRRLLREGLHAQQGEPLSVEQVEAIARRVMTEARH